MKGEIENKYVTVEKIRFTPREVSQRLGVPYWMVWRLSREAFKRNGKKWARFTEKDIEKMNLLLNEQHQGGNDK